MAFPGWVQLEAPTPFTVLYAAQASWPREQTPNLAQSVHVALSYILGPYSWDKGAPLGPKCIPCTYSDPFGGVKAVHEAPTKSIREGHAIP